MIATNVLCPAPDAVLVTSNTVSILDYSNKLKRVEELEKNLAEAKRKSLVLEHSVQVLEEDCKISHQIRKQAAEKAQALQIEVARLQTENQRQKACLDEIQKVVNGGWRLFLRRAVKDCFQRTHVLESM